MEALADAAGCPELQVGLEMDELGFGFISKKVGVV